MKTVMILSLQLENSTAPTLSPKESGSASLDRKKDRSRSKSPFRSFRWKKGNKSPAAGTGAHSDDESSLALAAGECQHVLGTRSPGFVQIYGRISVRTPSQR